MKEDLIPVSWSSDRNNLSPGFRKSQWAAEIWGSGSFSFREWTKPEPKPGSSSVNNRDCNTKLFLLILPWLLLSSTAESVTPLHSQFLTQAADLGLGVGELHREVLSALGPPHAGGVSWWLAGAGGQRGELHTVPLLRQLHDGLRDTRTRQNWDLQLGQEVMKRRNTHIGLQIQQARQRH